MDIVIGRAAINQTACLLSETELALSLSLPLVSRRLRLANPRAECRNIHPALRALSTVLL